MHPSDSHMNEGAGFSSPVALESVRITMDLYRSGKAGVEYAKLQAFSKPILAHYQIDLQTGFAETVTQQNLEDMTLLLDVLETAIVFWEYCSLPSANKPEAFKALQVNLIGPHPDKDDLVQFPVLVAAMEDAWEQLSDGKTVEASFEVSHQNGVTPQEAPTSSNGAHGYGPEMLEVPDAFALFARPLLENEAIYEDPESLDDAMSKAQAYWDLAHLPPNEVDQSVKIIATQLGSQALSAAQVEHEALQMIERFHELFPERK